MPKPRWYPEITVTPHRTAICAVALAILLACGRDDSVRRGRMFIEAGMFGEAIPVLRQAIQSKPNDPGAHFLLGTALLGIGDRSAAEEAFGRATLLDPAMNTQIGEAYYGVASAMLQRSDDSSIREGSGLLRAAIERNPKLIDQAADLWTARGFALTEADPPLAHLLLSAAQEVKPNLAKDEKVQLTRALTTADIDERRGQLETFVAAFPNSDQLSRAFFELANCYYTQNRYDEAVARLEYVVGHFPKASEASRANEMLSRITRERDDLRRIETERVASRSREEQLRKEAEQKATIEQARLKAQEEQALAETERRSQEREAKRARKEAERQAWVAKIAAAGGPFTVRSFNVDDLAKITVNGVIVVETKVGKDSGWIPIDEHLQPGENTVTFTLQEFGNGWAYGFQLKGSHAIIWQDQCGQLGKKGCTDDRFFQGEAYRKDYILTIK